MNESMNSSPLFDVAVIGGGLAGLAAAGFAARAGRSVILFEKAPQPGGRSTTHTTGGFHFNQGPHALYRGGEGMVVLNELGVKYSGTQASSDGSWALRNGGKFPLPRTPESLMACNFLSEAARREAVTLFGSLGQLPTGDWAHMPLREWLHKYIAHEDLRGHVEALIRLATYCNDPEHQSAGAALEQLITGGAGVDYLDGGWQTLVEALRDVAREAGTRIETRSRVTRIESDGGTAVIRLETGGSCIARSVISTVSPDAVARMVNGGDIPSLRSWAGDAIPIYAACLDVALRRLPEPAHQFAIDLDRSLYYSVHTRSARLAPGDAAVIQLAKYLPTDAEDSRESVEGELERLLDVMQPGWKSELVTSRFLPRMLVANAVATAKQGGTAGRPGPAVPEIPNLFVAGDWVGPHGMLADASLSSAKQAALLVGQWLESAPSQVAPSLEAAAIG